MNYTTNYELKKPAGTDFYDIGNENDNMDILDRVIKELDDDFTALETRVDTLAGNLTALTTRVATAETSIASMGSRLTTAENGVAGLKTRMTSAESGLSSLRTRTAVLAHDDSAEHSASGTDSTGSGLIVEYYVRSGICFVTATPNGTSIANGTWTGVAGSLPLAAGNYTGIRTCLVRSIEETPKVAAISPARSSSVRPTIQHPAMTTLEYAFFCYPVAKDQY